MKSRTCIGLFSLIALALISPSTWGATYQITNVFAQPAGSSLYVGGMNNAGHLVLNTQTNNPSNPFVPIVKPYLYLPTASYGLGAGVNDLSLQPGYANNSATNINNVGQIAGAEYLSNGFIMSALYYPAPAYSRPAGWARVDPTQTLQGGKMNDSGLIALHNHGQELAAVWAPAAGSGYSAGLNNYSDSARPADWGFGTDINEAGNFTGYQFGASSLTFAYLPAPAYARAAGWHTAPLMSGSNDSSPAAINNAGEIVGTGTFSSNSFFYQKGFLWRLGTNSHGAGGFFDLGGGNGDSVRPADINDDGIAVGTRAGSTGERAFFWSAATGLVDLNTKIDPASGWLLKTATAINNNGQIAGIGVFNGVTSAYILSLPEPSALTAALAGAAIPLMRRRPRP